MTPLHRRLRPFWSILLLLALIIAVHKPTQAQSGLPVPLTTSSYLGDSGSQEIVATRFATDSGILLAGTSTTAFPAAPTSSFGSDGTSGRWGFVTRLKADGKSVEWSHSFARGVFEPKALEIGTDGTLYLLGTGSAGLTPLIAGKGGAAETPFGSTSAALLKLAPDGSTITWGSFVEGSAEALALGPDGPVVAAGKAITRFSATGGLLGAFDSGFGNLLDLAVRQSDGRIVAIGWFQAGANLQVPLFKGFTSDGTVAWSAYGQQVAGEDADTRGEIVEFAPDGSLLAKFYHDGGNTILRRDPLNLGQSLPNSLFTGAFEPNMAGANAGSFSFIGRYNPDSGAILDATYVFARLSSGKPNSAAVTALKQVGELVYLVGGSACCMKESPGAWRTSAQYDGNELFLLVLPASLGKALFSSPLGATTNQATADPKVKTSEALRSLDAREGALLFGGYTDGSDFLPIQQPLQATQGGARDGVFALFTSNLPRARIAVRGAAPGAIVTLDGSGSTIPPGATATYSWAQTSGPTVALEGADSVTATFVAPEPSGSVGLVLGFSLRIRANGFEDVQNVIVIIGGSHVMLPVVVR